MWLGGVTDAVDWICRYPLADYSLGGSSCQRPACTRFITRRSRSARWLRERKWRTSTFRYGENLGNVKQTNWDPLLRPTRGIDGRGTVDAWAPLDGRNINGGVRVQF